MNGFFAIMCVCMVALAGCSNDITSVSGVVTMDGVPLEGAQLDFWPQGTKNDRPSTAVTDAEGRYTLSYMAGKEGAVIGQHKVSITTARDAEAPAVREVIPAKYNKNTTLTADVTSGGSTINFDLKSK